MNAPTGGRFSAAFSLAILAFVFACAPTATHITHDGATPSLIPQPRAFVITNGEQVPFTRTTIGRADNQ